MKRTLFVCLILIASASIGGAQTPPPNRAAQCRAEASNYQNTQFQAMRAAGKPLNAESVKPITLEGRRVARDCASKISIETASPAELTSLVTLYLFTTDTAKAKDAAARALNKPSMTETERAEAMIAGEQLAIATFDPFAGLNPEAEKFVAGIDALSDAVLAQKIRAHESLLGRYEYADIDGGLQDHARKLLALAKHGLSTNLLPMIPERAGVPAYNSAYRVMAIAYSSLARAQADYLHTDSALMILDEAFRTLDDHYPNAHRDLDGQRDMYRLVGTKATPIEGKWWINAPNGSALQPGDGKITFIQFTAHWCVPCRHSYPGMLHMATHFAGQPVEQIMETYLYGYVGSKTNLTPEQEVAEDRVYYTQEHGLPFRIAINPQLARGDTVTQDAERRYMVGGIPEIVVVDRKGVIRATVTGWDAGNEKRLTAFIEQILTEK
jgi:hypothetical protein